MEMRINLIWSRMPPGVSPTAPAARLTAAVDMIPQFVRLVRAHGKDGIVGADQTAGGAAHAGIGRIGFLANAVVDLETAGRVSLRLQGNR
jgi:hypothetical protein